MGLKPSEVKGASKGLEGRLKGASMVEGGLRGLRNGLKGASRGLQGGLKVASPSEGFKGA